MKTRERASGRWLMRATCRRTLYRVPLSFAYVLCILTQGIFKSARAPSSPLLPRLPRRRLHRRLPCHRRHRRCHRRHRHRRRRNRLPHCRRRRHRGRCRRRRCRRHCRHRRGCCCRRASRIAVVPPSRALGCAYFLYSLVYLITIQKICSPPGRDFSVPAPWGPSGATASQCSVTVSRGATSVLSRFFVVLIHTITLLVIC